MQELKQIISITGALLIVILFLLSFKLVKLKKIIKIMNKNDVDEIELKNIFKTKKYNRFIINKKIKKIKWTILMLLIFTILLILLTGGINYYEKK